MAKVLTRDQVRQVDRRAVEEYGMAGLVLMENAGRGAVDVLCRLMSQHSPASGPVAIVCGKGNNGGDGFVMARHLDNRGVAVKIMMLAKPSELRGDAAANFAIAEKAGIEILAGPLEGAEFDRHLGGAAWLVDALLGTGATGRPKPPLAEAIDRMNASGRPILAVDMPSGLDCDTGQAANPTIRATATCTFVAAKPGLLAPEASAYVGSLHVVDIGVPRRLLADFGIFGPRQGEKPGDFGIASQPAPL